MEDSWLDNVLCLVSEELKKGLNETIENLSDEMREDYLLSVKKAIGMYVMYICTVLAGRPRLRAGPAR